MPQQSLRDDGRPRVGPRSVDDRGTQHDDLDARSRRSSSSVASAPPSPCCTATVGHLERPAHPVRRSQPDRAVRLDATAPLEQVRRAHRPCERDSLEDGEQQQHAQCFSAARCRSTASCVRTSPGTSTPVARAASGGGRPDEQLAQGRAFRTRQGVEPDSFAIHTSIMSNHDPHPRVAGRRASDLCRFPRRVLARVRGGARVPVGLLQRLRRCRLGRHRDPRAVRRRWGRDHRGLDPARGGRRVGGVPERLLGDPPVGVRDEPGRQARQRLDEVAPTYRGSPPDSSTSRSG